ncbi:MAG: hypothetical protein PHU73_05480, partial [Patescibacteria group bacterium]|nr:hypothetical protein [Patescibacteria group bacterium]
VLRLILDLFGISFIRKNAIIYRRGYKNDGHSALWIPIKAVGRIFDYIRFRNRQEIKKITAPIMIAQARKSDLISSRCADYIFANVKSNIKEIFYLPVNNHDLNLMDEEGRILMIEKIQKFIEQNA